MYMSEFVCLHETRLLQKISHSPRRSVQRVLRLERAKLRLA